MFKQHSLIIYANDTQIANQIAAAIKDTAFEIKGISSTFEEVIYLLQHLAPNFLIINLMNPCSNPDIHQLKIASPRTRIIITEEGCNANGIFELIQAGADAFLTFPLKRDDILTILSNLVKDEVYIPPFVARSILNNSRQMTLNSHQHAFFLTERDKSILWCLSKGMEHEEIKACLGVKEDIIGLHLSNILQKIHFSDIVHQQINVKLTEVKSDRDQLELI